MSVRCQILVAIRHSPPNTDMMVGTRSSVMVLLIIVLVVIVAINEQGRNRFFGREHFVVVENSITSKSGTSNKKTPIPIRKSRPKTSNDATTMVRIQPPKPSSITTEVSKSPKMTLSSFHYNILCYGDSLTYGTSPPHHDPTPYGPILQTLLEQQHQQQQVPQPQPQPQQQQQQQQEPAHGLPANVTVARTYSVFHRGMPGWTAQQMLDNMDDPNTGLRTAVSMIRTTQQIQSSSSSSSSSSSASFSVEQNSGGVSLVIILVGTNDIGRHMPIDTIYDNIIQLHQMAYECHVPRSIMIGIPPSGYQKRVNDVANNVHDLNQKLQRYAQSLQEDRVSYVPFPFDYDLDANSNLWSPDTLHFSPLGYQRLAQSIVPVVNQILDELEHG
jgi:lysophospholipase L1-like esterase